MRSSERKYLEQMRTKGEIFMHSLSWFTTCPHENRRDENETLCNSEPIDTIMYPYMFLKPQGKEEIKVQLTKAAINTHGYYGYIFCMHYFTEENHNKPFSFDLKDGCVIMITDTEKFVERIKLAAQKEQLKLWYGKVEYMDIEKLNGNKTPFKKDLKFATDFEYRFYVQTNDKELTDEFRLLIGDITDISVIVDVEVGKSMFKIIQNSNPI